MLKLYIEFLLNRDLMEDLIFLTDYLTTEEIIGYLEFFKQANLD